MMAAEEARRSAAENITTSAIGIETPSGAGQQQRILHLEARIHELEATAGQLESYAADLRGTYSELRRSLQHMTALQALSTRLASSLVPDDVVETLLESLGDFVQVQTAAVYLAALDPATDHTSTLRPGSALPWELLASTPSAPLQVDRPRRYRVLQTAETGTVAAEAFHTRKMVERLMGPGEVQVAVPLIAGERFLGVLDLHRPALLVEEERRLLALLAAGVAVALHNAILHQETQQLATTDALTGLSNDRHFYATLKHEVDRAHRMNYPLGLAMLDLDHFKQVNDRYGHPAGNVVLREVADVLQQRLRRTDFIGRLGGEEFGAILPGASPAEVMTVGEKLRQAVEELRPLPASAGPDAAGVTISVGGISLAGPALTLDRLVREADEALYEAKRRGRNQVRLWGGRGVDVSAEAAGSGESGALTVEGST